MDMSRCKQGCGHANRGAVQVEHLVLISSVAVACAAGALILGRLLLNYHKTIEAVLALPIP